MTLGAPVLAGTELGSFRTKIWKCLLFSLSVVAPFNSERRDVEIKMKNHIE